MAGSSSPSLVDSLFQRSLDDLIRMLRSQPIGEANLLSKALDEIRREIRSTDLETKSVALQKLTYISSIHSIDMSWASFHALELLPSPSFLHKKLAYLAASLSFHPSTDVLLLITNQLRKDLTGNNDDVTRLALEFLAVAATPDLARDLTPEVYTLLASSKTSIRKKATAVVLRIFNKYPDSVRVAFKRLVENLECADQRVVSAAVGVFCELLSSDPKSYLPLAPEFYRILMDCKNNWVLIKVLKIFTMLVPLEPRLAKRVVDSVCEHMRRSMAKSLVFECVRTVLLSLDDYEHAVRLAVEKIREFLASEDDSNLRYLGLRALSMLRPRHSWAVEENREAVVKSLGDPDPNIQREALHLIMRMVTESNIVEISVLLVNYALKSNPGFCNDILGSILTTCSRNYYELITDFDWYVSILGEMARNPHCTKGEEIERQLVDIGLRVKDVRPELVRVTRDLLIDPALLGNHFQCRILSSAAWICGEYTKFSSNPWELVEALLQPRTNLLPPLVRIVYLQAVFKILLFCLNSYINQLEAGQFYSDGDLDSGSQIPGNFDVVRSDFLANHQFSEESSCMASKDAFASHKLDSGSQIPGDSDTVRSDAVANHQLNDESSCMASKDAIASQETTSMSGSVKTKGPFTYASIEHMLNLIETAVGPLSECDEVEVQERARNVLGLVHGLKEIRGCNFEEDLKKDGAITEIIRLMHDAFTEELGPVSENAQERVPIPDGLILREDLSELATILGNDDAKPHFSSSSFSLQSHHDSKNEEESAPLTDSNLLLSEHRKRHGLYYLPTEKIELENNDYPHVNDPGLPVNRVNFTGDATEDLLKLTDQSLVPKKTKQAKPRPVVVKLEEGEDIPESSLKLVEPKDDLLSGAVRDVLLDNKGKPTSSRKKSSDKSNQRRLKEDINLNSTSTSQPKENLGDTEYGSSSTRRSRHQSHGKSKHRSSRENKDEEEKNNMNSSRSSHLHGRHKHRQRGDVPLNVVPQTTVIQDFLL